MYLVYRDILSTGARRAPVATIRSPTARFLIHLAASWPLVLVH